MNDGNPFEVFGVIPRPILDLEPIQARLHQLGKTDHPDRAGSENERREREIRWKKINESFRVLTTDVWRLKCLLEFHGVEDPNASSEVPENVTDLFSKIGPLLHKCNEHLKKLDAAESHLERSMLQSVGLELATSLQQIAVAVGRARSHVWKNIQELDADWSSSPDVDGLLSSYRELVYIDRWVRQIDECQFRLMNA